LEGGVGRGSGEALSVSDLKFLNVMSWSLGKKEFFFMKRSAPYVDDKLLEPKWNTSYNVL